jgi:hypothetical protein
LDGNFKADHIRQKNPGDDVPLTDGQAFFTAPAPYKEYLASASKYSHLYRQVAKNCLSWHPAASRTLLIFCFF